MTIIPLPPESMFWKWGKEKKIKNHICSDNQQQWLKRGGDLSHYFFDWFYVGSYALNIISEDLDQYVAQINTSLHHEVDLIFDCVSSLDSFVLEKVFLLPKSWNPLLITHTSVSSFLVKLVHNTVQIHVIIYLLLF